jgi:hypothetical protein
MHKTYEKPSLELVASLQKFTAAPAPIASYCDYVGEAPLTLAVPEDECEDPRG